MVLRFLHWCYTFLHWCYTFLHSFLSQSESSNFFMYVIKCFHRSLVSRNPCTEQYARSSVTLLCTSVLVSVRTLMRVQSFVHLSLRPCTFSFLTSYKLLHQISCADVFVLTVVRNCLRVCTNSCVRQDQDFVCTVHVMHMCLCAVMLSLKH